MPARGHATLTCPRWEGGLALSYDRRMRTPIAALAALCLAVPALAQAPVGTASVRLVLNPLPAADWQAGEAVVLSADARRNGNVGQEDIFWRQVFGSFARGASQTVEAFIHDVRPGEKIIVQAYMCSQVGGDCYPSDKDNPPSCGAEVRILGNLKPSCTPTFTWTGGSAAGGVLCSAGCR